MEKTALKLKEKIEEMTVLYTRFHALLTLEQGCLASNKAGEHAEIVREKERLAEKIQLAEEERIALSDAIAGMLKRDRRALKVSDIAAYLGKEPGQALLNAKSALQTILAQVKALNEINNQLLADSMEYVKSAMEIVAGKQDLRQGYGKGGTIKTSVNVKRNLVNTRA